MADQVIGFLQDIAAAVMAVWHRRELPHREVEGEIIRPPMFEGNWGNKPERCLVDEAFKGLVADPVVCHGCCVNAFICPTVDWHNGLCGDRLASAAAVTVAAGCLQP